MNKIILTLMFAMLLVGTASAWTSSEFIEDTEKVLEKIDTTTKFGTYKIEESSWYDPLQIWTKKTLKEIDLKNNTDICGGDIGCLSSGTIVLNKDGTLIDDLIWKRSFDGGNTFVDWSGFINWKFLVEEDVDVFETTCKDGKEIIDEKNGTSYFEQDCITSKVGTEKQWKPLDFKKEYKAGTYNYKIEGNKKPNVIYDWIIKTNGEILDKWAVWGAVIGEGGVEASVTLNSPANNSIHYTNQVTTSASANVTGGAFLVNATLYDNSTGTWGARNTNNIIASDGLVSYYTLDEASGTTVYDALGNYNGTNNGATVNQVGKIGKGYSFDGTNDYISLGNFMYNNLQNIPYSISVWFKLESIGDYQAIILNEPLSDRHTGIWVSNLNKLKITMNAAGSPSLDVSGGTTLSAGVWYNVILIYNKGTGVYAYLNNNLEISQSTASTYPILSGETAIGRKGIKSDNYFDGLIDEVGIWNRSLTADEITYLYNSGAGRRPSNTTTTITFTNTYSAGDVVDWNMQFCDSDGDCGFAPSNRTFSIDGGAPTIALNYPTSLIDYGKINGTLQLNFTATDDNLDSVWYNYNGTNRTITTLVENPWSYTNWGSSEPNNEQDTEDYLQFSSGGTWNDIGGTSNNYALCEFPNKTYHKSSTTMNWNNAKVYCEGLGGNLAVIRDANENAAAFAVGGNGAWLGGYQTSKANEPAGNWAWIDSYSNVDITGDIIISIPLEKDLYTATIYANDTAGNLQVREVDWSYKVFENSRSFTTPIVETSLDTFIINVTSDVSLSSVYLNYNGTEYSTSLSGGVYTKQLNIPAVTEESIIPVYWRFVYAGTNITSDITNQTISKLVFNICNATINNTLINFTTKSATNPFPVVNSTFKSSWMLSASVGATPTNFTYEDIDGNKSSYAFCTNTNTTTIYTDAEVEYDGESYALNFYYLEDFNLTATNPQNISLYLLNDSLAAVTILKVVSASQQPQEEHQINIQSYDVGTGTFYLVGMAKTNFNGEDVVYLNWYDTLYKFIVLDKNGDVVKTTGTTKISSSPTTIELENEITFPYDKFEDFVYSLYYENSTSNFVLTYTKPSGEVDEACLRVYKHGQGNDTLVCDECETSASATMFCNVASYGNGTYVALFYATGSFSLVDWIYEYVGGTFQTTIYNLLGNKDASFYAFLFAGLITVALFINAVFGIIALMIGLIGASALGFTALQWGQMTGVIIIGGFIIWILKR